MHERQLMTNEEHQQAIYSRRFTGIEERRMDIWQTLSQNYFHRWIKPTDTVLDLGAGYCEFINSIPAGQKYALDSNPDTAKKAGAGVTVLSQNAAQTWPLSSHSIDVVFTSNFFEHLPSKQELSQCLTEAYRVLRPEGRLIALGPNIRFCSENYWDYVDHHLPLSDRSLAEALEITGFQSERIIPRFLPFTMNNRVPHRAFMLRIYLRLPFVQRLLGKQFLIVARKPKP